MFDRHAEANFPESAEGNGNGDIEGVTRCNVGFFVVVGVCAVDVTVGFRDFSKCAPFRCWLLF